MTLLLPRIHYGLVTTSLEKKEEETEIGTWPLELNPNISFVLCVRGCNALLSPRTHLPLKMLSHV